MHATLALALVVAALSPARQAEPVPLSTGKLMTPIGRHFEVGPFPCNLALSPDGRFLAVTNVGSRQTVRVFDTRDFSQSYSLPFQPRKQGARSENLYFGLQFARRQGQNVLLVSHGSAENATVHPVAVDGALSRATAVLQNPNPTQGDGVFETAGIAHLEERGETYVANNYAALKGDLKGSVSVFDSEGKRAAIIPVPGYPLDVAAVGGPKPRLFVSCERDGVVAVIDLEKRAVERTVPTGANATHLLLNPAGTRLYVSNSNADTVSVLDTPSLKVVQTILLRPNVARGLPGATPLGLCLSPDGKTLYAAMADLNAIAAVNLPEGTLRGYIPTGWYPTAVQASKDGKRLFVASAKGVAARNPNPKSYILDTIAGSVSVVPVPTVGELAKQSERVLLNNRVARIPEVERVSKSLNPGIKHVVYVIKENRTYDNILGDLPKGNGDPSLCLFPREVTPNQHALAERFVLLDNFYVCAEVSADGWNWSTGGIANEYNQRNKSYNYSGRGRQYDFEGTNSGVAPDLAGLTDVSQPHGGYLWDQALKHGKTVRNYGAFVAFGDSGTPPYAKAAAQDNGATRRNLIAHTSPDYRRYDLTYADSDAWVKYGVSAPNQMKTYGKYKARSRFEAWEREYRGFLAKKSMPNLMVVRLPNDHTNGTAAGRFSPRAMVADNDYAVGQIVQTISQGPLWKQTAIIILEDDAQAGYDHIDAHRSIAFVVSPYVERGSYSNAFYNTDSALRTIEALLGIPPMNSYDAIAMPFQVFGKKATNLEPYKAILPAKEIVCEVNKRTAYRSADSARLISRFQEESLPDIELNDILWGSIKGAKTPRPPVRNNVISTED